MATAPKSFHSYWPRKLSKRALFGAALVGLMTGCGPSPEAVCQKTFELAKAEVGEALANKAIGGDMGKCVESESLRKDLRGWMKYKDNNACLMKSSTWAEVKGCSK